MTIKLLALTTLMLIGTVIFVASVVLEEPPAFIAFIFGALTGGGWIGLIAVWLWRCDQYAEQ